MILLASRSPQRRALLGALGVEFRVVVSGIVEGEDPLDNARAKAEEVVRRVGIPAGGAVLGADTEVVLDGRALGKPADGAGAAAMLAALSGRAHVVRTAVCMITQRDRREIVDDTTVVVRPLSEAMTSVPRTVAGQGGALERRTIGCGSRRKGFERHGHPRDGRGTWERSGLLT